jgi:alkanesulfonate monooxygenase SsuD/methylene tetrahydromethanopterin reductase-like flavin-dependent oxidoreductase (luciferase family)
MVAISVSIEGWFGLTWSHWKRLVTEVEQLGYAGLFLSDHFLLQDPPPSDSLELIVALTYLADHTQRVHFGAMVSPLSVRDPVMLARQAGALDDLSGGRMILGVGAGWNEPEHLMFGYDLGDMTTRMARFEEGLEVIARLLRNDGAASYQGQFFQLRDALLLPRPHRPGGPPLLIGGIGPRRTLPLVAHYADIWNANLLNPVAFSERSAHLDRLLLDVGRQPGDVKRTVNIPVFCGRSRTEIEQRVRGFRQWSPFSTMPLDELLDQMYTIWAAIAGTPEQVIEQIRAYEAAGVEEFMVQWFAMDDSDGLKLLAEQVLPHVASS